MNCSTPRWCTISALKPLAEPLLRRCPTATRTCGGQAPAFLDWFLPLELDLIPDNSLLREFIGGSILKEFRCGAGITAISG